MASRRTVPIPANDSWDLRDTRRIPSHGSARPTRKSESDLVYRLVERGAWRNHGRTIDRIPGTPRTSHRRRASAAYCRRCLGISNTANIREGSIGFIDSVVKRRLSLEIGADTNIRFAGKQGHARRLGAHHRLSISGLVHASNTMRAGPLKVRVTTSSSSDFRSTVVRFFMGPARGPDSYSQSGPIVSRASHA